MVRTARRIRCHGRIARSALIALLVIAIVLAAAGYVLLRPNGSGPSVPLPADLATLEPTLAARIQAAAERVRQGPQSGDAWGRLGAVYDVHDMTSLAIDPYERAAALDPNNFRWPYFLGICLRTSDQERAITQFERAALLNGDYAPIHFYLGYTHFLAGRLTDAEPRFRRALELDPRCINAHFGLARIALAQSEPERALDHLHQAEALRPTSGEINQLSAEVFRRLGRLEEAERHGRLAAERPLLEPLRDPIRRELVMQGAASNQLRRSLSDQLARQGRVDEAIELWQRAVRDDPNSSTAHLELSAGLAVVERLEEAFDHARTAVALDPESPEALMNLGGLLARGGAREDAIRTLEQAVELAPESPAARNNLAGVLLRSGRIDEAIAHMQEAAGLDPENAVFQFNLAMVLRDAGRRQEAVEAFDRVLRLDPESVRIRFELGRTLMSMGDFARAAAVYAEAAMLQPENVEARLAQAQALQGAGRFAESLAVVLEAHQRLPEDPSLRQGLAWILATSPDDSLRDGERALDLATRLCEETDYKDARLLDTLAAACAEVGDFTSAVRHQEKAVRIFRENAGARPSPFVAELIRTLERRLEGYREGRAHRESVR